MTGGLKVVTPGLHSTIQDLGRRGYQHIGMPVSGALDRIAFTLANALVGNPANAPGLEILLQGPVLEVVAASVRVALFGGCADLVIEGDRGRNVACGQSARAAQGERLRIGFLGDASCAYLAIEGGFDVPPCLGSASTYAHNQIGGFEGRALKGGDLLPVRLDHVGERSERALGRSFDMGLDRPIRVVPGPQQDYFIQQALSTLLSATYTISPQADRMGFRLEGPQLDHAKGYNIVSDGIVAGSIQVPGSGRPIVLLADAQTTGGYPKIATVISADVPVIGRRKPGSTVQFVAVTQQEAEAARREQDKMLQQWMSDLQPITEPPRVDLQALYASNLIDGVAGAFD